MEKTIQLDPREMQQATGIEEQRMRALAQIGALSLDMEQARKNHEVANERQREFIRQVLESRGIEQFDSARAVPNGILVSIPDSIGTPVKANGSIQPGISAEN